MLTLDPESFTRIDTKEEFRQIGVRAQALQKILPEAVRENDTGFLSANYGAAAMVIALNLVREVAALKARL
jgi:DNA polymerase III sliding clamp (beta) subunit (PCNA family)